MVLVWFCISNGVFAQNCDSAPVANPDQAYTFINQPLLIDVLANDSNSDGSPLTIQSVGTLSCATITVLDNGMLLFDPISDQPGNCSFSYTVTDGQQSATSQVSVDLTKMQTPAVEIDPQDPHRFVRDGEPLTFAGYFPGMHALTVQGNVDVVFPPNDQRYYQRFFDVLAENRINLMRVYLTTNMATEDYQYLQPYKRSDICCNAHDGFMGNRYDLSQFNDSFFIYWEEVLDYANEKGVVVIVALWEARHTWGSGSSTGWVGGYTIGNNTYTAGRKYDFYTYPNNVNGVDSDDQGSDSGGPAGWYTRSSVLNAQKEFVRKVVAELGHHGNIIWEIANEPWRQSGNSVPHQVTTWIDEISQEIRDAEAAGGFDTHLIMPLDLPEHRDLPGHYLPSQGVGIPPHQAETLAELNGDLVNSYDQINQPIISDNDCCFLNGTPEQKRKKAWTTLVSGGYAMLFDFLADEREESIFDAERIQAINWVGNTQWLMEHFNLDLRYMAPRNDLVTSQDGRDVWCLALENQRYLIYLEQGGRFDLANLPTHLDFWWFNPQTREMSNAAVGTDGFFQTPDYSEQNRDDWVLFIGGEGGDQQTPFTGDGLPHPLPGRIEIEDFDQGGIGVAYHDSSPGNSGTYQGRMPESVDLGQFPDGTVFLEHVTAGEWLEFTVQIPNAGNYDLSMGYTSTNLDRDGALRLQIASDGVDHNIPMPVHETWGPETWNDLFLPAGEKIIRLLFADATYAINWFELQPSEDTGGPEQTPFTSDGLPHPLPGRIEIEDYDEGGRGIAYHDTSMGNFGNYDGRSADWVDLTQFGSGAVLLGWVKNGEWLEYTVNIPSSGEYDFSIAYQTNPQNREGILQLEILEDGVDFTIPMPIHDQFAVETTSGLLLPAGEKVIRLYFFDATYDINWFELNPSVEVLTVTADDPTGDQVLPGSNQSVGATVVDVPISRSFYIHNGHPQDPLNIQNLNVTGQEWSITQQPSAPIPAGGHGRLEIEMESPVEAAPTGTVSFQTTGATAQSFEFTVSGLVDVASQLPYKGSAWLVPGDESNAIPAWKYDLGGSETAYVDMSPLNTGGYQRPLAPSEAVDLVRLNVTGPVAVMNTEQDEWLEYTLDISPSANGYFDMVMWVAIDEPLSGETSAFELFLDDQYVNFSDREIRGTNGHFHERTLPNLILNPGSGRILRIKITEPGLQLRWFYFREAVSPPPTSSVVAVPDQFSVPLNTTLSTPRGSLLQNDLGAGGTNTGHELEFHSFVTLPTKGSFIADETFPYLFHYTPFAGAQGNDQFSYRCWRPSTGDISEPGVVTLQILPADAGPVLNPDYYTVPMAERITLPASVLLENDLGDNLSITDVVDQADHGQADFHFLGINYESDAGYSGPDQFTYAAVDGSGIQSGTPGQVFLNVVAPPQAQDDGPYQVQFQTSMTLTFEQLMANDEDHPLPVHLEDFPLSPQFGSIQVDYDSRTVIYTPDVNFSGSDSFTYRLQDEFPHEWLGQFSNQAVVQLQVSERPVTANPDVLLVDERLADPAVPFSLDQVLDNDHSQYQLLITQITEPSWGTLFLSGNQLVYEPDPAFWNAASDQFTYTVTALGAPGDVTSHTAEVTLIPWAMAEPTLFEDDLELGNLSAWHSASANVTVTADAALSGSFGAAFDINPGDSGAFVRTYLDEESHLRTTFRFDPSQLDMAEGNNHLLLNFSGMSRPTLSLSLLFQNGIYQIRVLIFKDDGNFQGSSWAPLSGGLQELHLEWWAASGPGADDGGSRLFVDRKLAVELNNIDNDLLTTGHLLFGAPWGIDPGTEGRLSMDDFRIERGQRSREVVFQADVELGDLSAFHSVAQNGGTVVPSAGAAISGNWGIEFGFGADTTSLFVRDDTPDQVKHFLAAFQFDPNGVQMPAGSEHVLAYGAGGGRGSFVLKLRLHNGSYQIRLIGYRDDLTLVAGNWVDLSGDPQSIALEWWSSSFPGLDEGGGKLWLDDAAVDQLSGVDNDELQIDNLWLGAVWGVQPGTSGSYFIDNIQTWVGPDHADDLSFEDFEAGSLAAFETVIQNGGQITTDAAAALHGTRGMSVELLQGSQNVYVVDGTPDRETHMAASFSFDPNGIQMAESENYILMDWTVPGHPLMTVVFSKTGGSYQMRLNVFDDNGTLATTPWATVPDDKNRFNIEWRASSRPLADDGFARLWHEGLLVGEVVDLDNDRHSVDKVRFGAVYGIDSGTQGTTYFDNFRLQRGSQGKDVLHWDDFESGAPSGWDDVIGDVLVTPEAALTGTRGLETAVTAPSTQKAFVRKNFETPATTLKTSFLLDASGVNLPSGDAEFILATTWMETNPLKLKLWKISGGGYQLQLVARDQLGTVLKTPIVDLSGTGAYWIYTAWEAGLNGRATLVIEEQGGAGSFTSHELNGIVNSSFRAEYLDLGRVSSIGAGSDGVMFIDDVRVWR